LVPYSPVDGPDNRFGQIHKPLSPDAYKAAGIEGFAPPSPRFDFSNRKHFDETTIPSDSSPEDDAINPSLLIDFQNWHNATEDDKDLHFPSLWELNQELHDFGEIDIDALIRCPDDSSTMTRPHLCHLDTYGIYSRYQFGF
jgi:hypothetical protein